MGAFLIFDISFKDKRSLKKFEKIYKPKILVDENSNSFGFSAWLMLHDPELRRIYDMGFLGYNEPTDILLGCKEEKIKIKFFAFIPINDRLSSWEKLKGKY